ncbi:helix-turn-helix domain-containing protein [Leptospira interrogans]|uniref:helix-turn-helix domain-containing protein n=1 Tax=Leptospira interrogans TaxID=173 RepID=UPI00034D0E16|nr:helix-turn-helix transcriptional regulator [Leptospira interrogans]
MSSKKQPSVDQIIAKWDECLEGEELDRQILTNYIREFVEAQRGNQALLARESGIDPPVIVHLLKKTQDPSFERILKLSKIVQKLLKYQ